MIGRLKGEAVSVEGSLLVVDVGGVGYEVQVPDALAAQFSPGDACVLFTRQVVREDSLTLYGFDSVYARRLFDLLLSVTGCGPRIGLALLGQVGEETVTAAIVNEDARSLTRATGVGNKLAERIVLELREKVQLESLTQRATGATARRRGPDEELIDALMNLGYRRSEAESAAAQAGEGEESDRLRRALQILRR